MENSSTTIQIEFDLEMANCVRMFKTILGGIRFIRSRAENRSEKMDAFTSEYDLRVYNTFDYIKVVRAPLGHYIEEAPQASGAMVYYMGNSGGVTTRTKKINNCTDYDNDLYVSPGADRYIAGGLTR